MANYAVFNLFSDVPKKYAKTIVRLAASNQSAEQNQSQPYHVPPSIDQMASDASMSSTDLDAPDTDEIHPQAQEFAAPNHYYPRSALTTPARPLIEPELPSTTDELNGLLILVLLINETGIVDAVQEEKSAWPSEYVDSLKNAFSKMLFDAGSLNGNTVKSRFEVVISMADAPTIIQTKTIEEELPSP